MARKNKRKYSLRTSAGVIYFKTLHDMTLYLIRFPYQ